jgi:protein-S-isoprenylcysteine O-methyltransferase Ste14
MDTKETNNRTRSLIRRRFAQIFIQFAVIGLILFITAGTVSWISAWLYLAAGLAIMLLALPVLLRKNPGVIAERAQVKKDTKQFDRIFNFYSTVITLAMLVCAGLDYRYGWSTGIPLSLRIIGLVFYISGMGLFYWALISNKFFSTTVRIQTESGHFVVREGPYRYVRHPGYSGMILATIGVPLLLGSYWTLIPALMVVTGYLVRTLLEDRTLKEELSGYNEFCTLVPDRIIPGVW